MTPVPKCKRCLLPLLGTNYTMRLETNPPQPESLEVLLCEGCVESLSRWLTRRKKEIEGFRPGVSAPQEDSGRLAKSSRRRRMHAREIDEFESSSKRGLVLGLFVGTVALVVLIVGVSLAILGSSSGWMKQIDSGAAHGG